MRLTNRAVKEWILVGGVILLIVATLAGSGFVPVVKFQHQAKGFLGKPEAQVIEKLGAPDKVVRKRDVGEGAGDWWWGENMYPAPTYPIANKVLVYYFQFAGALLYIGTSGVVEHVHLIGT
jgi:hypothetical protein